jgi:Single-strand binding protein family
MSLFPRLRQACRGERHQRSPLAGAASALRGQDSRLALNRLFLSGVLAADPQEDRGRDGDPVTLLLVAFPAPDGRDTQGGVEAASCEVEVPARVAGKHVRELRPGESIFITGQLSGGGGVIATEVHSGPPP